MTLEAAATILNATEYGSEQMKYLFPAACAVALLALSAGVSHAGNASEAVAYCQSSANDNRINAIPDEMLAPAAKMLGVEVPQDRQVRGLWRCMDGKVMLCIPGGQRHCGRADTQVMPSPEARKYCVANPSAPEVPAWATGRDTIFGWRCEGPEPIVSGAVRSVDARGFVKEYWRAYEPQQH